MGFDNRNWLNQQFSDLEIGWHEDIDNLSDDQLEKLIDRVRELFSQYPGGVESNDFMVELQNVWDELTVDA